MYIGERERERGQKRLATSSREVASYTHKKKMRKHPAIGRNCLYSHFG